MVFMMWLAIVWKWLLVGICLVAGVLLLAAGIRDEIPVLKFRGLEAYGVLAGVAILIAGVVMARLWRIATTRTVTTQYVGPYGVLSITEANGTAMARIDSPDAFQDKETRRSFAHRSET